MEKEKRNLLKNYLTDRLLQLNKEYSADMLVNDTHKAACTFLLIEEVTKVIDICKGRGRY